MTARAAADRARRLEREVLVATQHENHHENGDVTDTWLADLERKLAAGGADGGDER